MVWELNGFWPSEYVISQGKKQNKGTWVGVWVSVLFFHIMTGHYAYIEASSPRSKGDKARLINGPFSDVLCLHFSYSMVGSSIGELNIYHVLHGMELAVWSKAGPQAYKEWHSDNATLYGKNYYVSLLNVNLCSGFLWESFTMTKYRKGKEIVLVFWV